MNQEDQAIRIVIDAARELADRLEELLGRPAAAPMTTALRSDRPAGAVFDPVTDTPPVRPARKGTREQEAWCGLMLFGQLRALNVRQNRGARLAERVDMSRAAGYIDGRGWAGWKPVPYEDDENGDRWINELGMNWLRHYANELNVSLPDDLL